MGGPHGHLGAGSTPAPLRHGTEGLFSEPHPGHTNGSLADSTFAPAHRLGIIAIWLAIAGETWMSTTSWLRSCSTNSSKARTPSDEIERMPPRCMTTLPAEMLAS